jgi:cytochrome c5
VIGKSKLVSDMNNSNHLKTPLRTTFIAIMVLAALMTGLAFTVFSAESKAGGQPAKADSAIAATNAVASQSSSPEASPQKARMKRQLTGAELYSINCNRCHPERAPTDWTGAEWKTIMLQMQVRANIPAKQAKLILQYLQENSGR